MKRALEGGAGSPNRPGWQRTLPLVMSLIIAALANATAAGSAADALEQGFQSPPPAARPQTYWLWLNGHVHLPSAKAELEAMKNAGLGGVLLFEMGARGNLQPPPGPAFLSPEWVARLKETSHHAQQLGLQVDMSVISSWDMGGPWIEPRHAVMALYSTEASAAGGRPLDLALPFPTAEAAAPKGPDGKPAFWTDVAVLALRSPQRRAGHEFVIQLDPPGVHALAEVVLDQGRPDAPPELAATMTPVRDFAVAVSTTGTREGDFTEVVRGSLPTSAEATRFALPAGTKARHVRLTLLSGHDPARPRWTLGEFSTLDANGRNMAGSRYVHDELDGAMLVRAPVPLSYRDWNAENIFDGALTGAGGVFATAGLPPFEVPDAKEVIDVTAHVDRAGRLQWDAPAGQWAFLRYVCMITGERLKVPSPSSDGLASDHLNPEATRVHMNHVVKQLQAGLGDLRQSGLKHLYLASYEVVGKVWSPVFAGEFQRRRGYALTRFLPAIFGARIGDEETTERFLFDYTKTLGEVVVDAYYRTAREVAHAAGLTIKSEAGGPGPPIHTPPFDALLANGAVDAVQGEFWPFWMEKDSIWVVKEPASAAHIYGKRIVHLEAFTSFHHWAEGPQDLKPSADRVFTEGGNHMVWHTWTHQPPDAGLPGWAYGAGTHLSRSVTWWPKARPFLEYLARCSYLLQRGHFIADVLYYYGDGGANFVRPRKNPPDLGPGYDYDVTNADVILNRLSVRNGRLVLPDGMSYAVLVLPEREDIHPAVLARIEKLVSEGATIIGPRPVRASGLEGFPASDARVKELAARLWDDLDGRARTSRKHGTGRIVHGKTEREVLAEMGVAPDFVAPGAFDFTHRRDGDTEIYFVRNREPAAAAGNIRFRAGGRAPELWDPRTGAIAPAGVFRVVDGGVEVPLALAPHGSIFVVFSGRAPANAIATVSDGASIERTADGAQLVTRSPGTYLVTTNAGRRSEVRVAPLPESLALDADWTVEFASPAGSPPKLELAKVGAWTQQPAPELRYFAGSARYRRSFALPEGWRARAARVELDLGRLWAIGEVWVNGTPLGVLWTAPFRIDCTSALRDGPNEIVVEVVGTWHNRLIGEARSAVPRWTRTNILVSQRKPWKDLEPIEAGLFGPVRLVPLAVQRVE